MRYILLFVTIVSALFSSDLKLANELFEKGKYSESKEVYEKLAKEGNPIAQDRLGYLHSGIQILFYLGKKEKAPQDLLKMEDKKKAVYWYRKAALQDYDKAQLDLGMMYEDGEGVLKDNNKAYEWFLKAANQGNSTAMLRIAYMYQDGRLKENNKKMIEWFKKSANKENSMAQKILGQLYSDGKAVLRDYKKSIYWYKKAIKNGDTISMCEIVNPLIKNENSDKSKKIARKYVEDAFNKIEYSYCKKVWEYYKLYNY